MSADIESRDIPDAWVLMPLKELGEWSGGGTPSKAKSEFWTKGKIPWVSPKDMKTERITDSEDHITESAVEESTAKLIPAGSVLIVTRSGILSHTLPVAVTTVPVTVNQDLKAITPKGGVLPEFLAWALRCFAREILNTCSKQGTTVASIETAALQRFEIPLAPIDQQKRIVAEIEKQFSRLDEAVANLKRVKANLKRYKASVLKAAVEGRLVETEAEIARREGRNYETGEQLLQRILETRRSQWKGKGKYKEPAAPATTNLPELPEGWAVASLEQLTSSDRVICYGILMPKENVPGGVLYVKVRDLKGDKVDMESLQRTSPDIAAKYARASLKTGDLLLAIRGTYGRIAEVPPELDGGNITQDTARLAVSPLMDRNYVAWFLRSLDAQNYFKRVARGVAVKGVNIADVRVCPIFLPSLSEQRRIVAEVDQRLSLVHEVEWEVDANLKRGERLKQAILATAFDGSLLGKEGSRIFEEQNKESAA